METSLSERERLWNVYAGQKFLTPGARETVDIASALVPASGRPRILDVACGKGTGAMLLAERHRCLALGVDLHHFVAHLARDAAARGLADRVGFVVGDGGRLPVRDAAFDVAICIGAPSIVGIEHCLAEMARALRTGGALVVSDWVWAKKPVPPGAIPPGFDIEPLTLDEYVALVRGAGLEIVSAEPLPQSVWDEYYRPLCENIAALRATNPGDVPDGIDDEFRVYGSGLGPEYWRYAVFVGRKL